MDVYLAARETSMNVYLYYPREPPFCSDVQESIDSVHGVPCPAPLPRTPSAETIGALVHVAGHRDNNAPRQSIASGWRLSDAIAPADPSFRSILMYFTELIKLVYLGAATHRAAGVGPWRRERSRFIKVSRMHFDTDLR